CVTLSKSLIDSFTLMISFFFSSRRRHTRSKRDWSSDVCSSDLFWRPCPCSRGRGALRPRCWTLARPARARGPTPSAPTTAASSRSEERRVGKKCLYRVLPYSQKIDSKFSCCIPLFQAHLHLHLI